MVSVWVELGRGQPAHAGGHGAVHDGVGEREQRADGEGLGAGAGHDQHAEEADQDRRPARHPTCSRRKIIEASVAKIGAEKLIATALASGISENAIIRNVCEQDCETPRNRWPLKRVVWNTASPARGRMMIDSPISGMNTREHSTSPIG